MWINKGFEFEKGEKIKRLLHSTKSYEIYSTVNATKLLIVNDDLYKQWLTDELIEEVTFSKIDISNNPYYYIFGNGDFVFTNVKSGYSTCNKDECMAFTKAFIKARKKTEVSLFDAIYLEEYSLILPTYTGDDYDDKTTFGTWLSGGVVISTDNFKRLNNLVAFLSSKDLKDVIESAGFDVFESGNYLTKQIPIEYFNENEEDEISNNKPNVKSGKFSLVGRPYLEEFINDNVVDILQNEEKYRKMGIDFPSAIILHGAPGCGKTFAVDKLVEFLDLPCYEINSSTVASPYIHDTSKKIAEIFDRAIENSPSVIVIDEMEAYLTDRGVGASSGLHHVEEVAEFLRKIPEAIKHKVLVIAMTNMIDLIDPAILRRGRFDHVIEVSMPSKEEVEILLMSLLKKLPIIKDLDFSMVVDKLTGKPLSDVTYVVREAARFAVKNDIEEIDSKCLEEAMLRLPKNNGNSKKVGF